MAACRSSRTSPKGPNPSSHRLIDEDGIADWQGKKVENTIAQDEPVFGLVGSDDDSDLDSDSECLDGVEHCKQNKHQRLDEPSIPMTPITPNSATLMIDPSTAVNEEAKLMGVKRRKMVTGLSFLIRREKGTTARLFTKSLRLPTLVEGPYPLHLSLTSLAMVPCLVCISGGLGLPLSCRCYAPGQQLRQELPGCILERDPKGFCRPMVWTS